MGSFQDGIAITYFKKDKNGTTLFFPWGLCGRGRVLQDNSIEEKVRQFVYRFSLICAVAGIVAVKLGGIWVLLSVMTIFFFWYCFRLKSLLSGCPYSEEKLTRKEVFINMAKYYNRFFLWLFLIFSMVMLLFAIVMFYISLTMDTPNTNQMAPSLFLALVAGFLIFYFAYMLILKEEYTENL